MGRRYDDDDWDDRHRPGGGRIVAGILAGLLVTAGVGAGLTAGYLTYEKAASSANEPTLPALIGENTNQTTSVPFTQNVKESESTVSTTSGNSAIIGDITSGKKDSEPASNAGAESTESTAAETTAQAAESTTQAVESTTAAKPVEEPTTKAASMDERKAAALEKFTNLGVAVNVKNYLNIRSAPSTDGEVCGKIFPYCGANILEDAGNGWSKVESGGAIGYVATQFLATGQEARDLALDHLRYQAELMVDTVEVYSSPNYESNVLTSIIKGDRFDILSENNSWTEIEIAEDLGGFIPTEDVKAEYHLEEGIVFGLGDNISQVRKDIINSAFEYYGGTYVFGGTSLTEGIDCSSFTQQIYGMHGITLTRNSYTQAGEGVLVDEKDVRPGDLLFYYGRHPEGIGHVAIYIGNGKIIHAASEKKGICVSDWKFVPIVTIRDVIKD